MPSLDFDQLVRAMADHGCTELLIKELAPNDNSKNQPYIAKDRELSGFSILPAASFVAEGRNFHAKLDFSWLDDDGVAYPAPKAKLIQYSRYNPPEVRLSGFLQGCARAPSEIMTTRQTGRVLVLGIADSRIYAYAARADDTVARAAKQLIDSRRCEKRGALWAVAVSDLGRKPADSIQQRLLAVHALGWIEGCKLGPDGHSYHRAVNAGGTTLEAVLGVSANSLTEPDLLGWELKAVRTSNRNHFPEAHVVTLITPNPTGGFYKESGAAEFLLRYGYRPKNGAENRVNYSGVHRFGVPARTTSAVLDVSGYTMGGVPTPEGSIDLVMADGELGASWSFVELLTKWNRKHAQTVFVPYERSEDGESYRYSSNVLFCRGSTFGRFVEALVGQSVYYDPGLKLEGIHLPTPKAKARHQFRSKLSDVRGLYTESNTADLVIL